MDQERLQFIKEISGIDKNGKIHKGKLSMVIADYVDKKINKINLGEVEGKEPEGESQFDTLAQGLKEMSKNILEMQDVIDGRDKKIEILEERISQIEKAGPSGKKINLKK